MQGQQRQRRSKAACPPSLRSSPPTSPDPESQEGRVLLVGNGRCKLGAETRGPQKQRARSTWFSCPQPRPLHAELSPGLTAARLRCRSLGDRHHDDGADASPDLGTRRRRTKKGAPPEEGALPRQPHLCLEWPTRSLRHLERH